jgi:hypothetical protein
MTNQQFSRTVQALNETYAAIANMESPKALRRDESLIAWHHEHAAKLASMINEYKIQ